VESGEICCTHGRRPLAFAAKVSKDAVYKVPLFASFVASHVADDCDGAEGGLQLIVAYANEELQLWQLGSTRPVQAPVMISRMVSSLASTN
jgi:hypothetical protein